MDLIAHHAHVAVLKARGLVGKVLDPLEVTLTTGPDGELTWLHQGVEDATHERVLETYRAGITKVRDIAEELGNVSRSTVQRHLARARRAGAM